MVNVNKVRMKIYVLDNGRMKMDKNLMIANSNKATTEDPEAKNEMHEFTIYTVFIDNPEDKIISDTEC
ncbi:N-acyl homoserine lactonase family protein, partial [Mammaliicoccus sciuri]